LLIGLPRLPGVEMHQKILLIDDSKAIHPLMSALIGNAHVTIHSAMDAQSGLHMAATLQPDLILLDVDMPGIDGFETCRRLRADPTTAGLPVIFITGRTATEEMVRGLNMGANDYVTKPFNIPELQSRVHAALRTSHKIRLLEEKAMIDPLTRLGNRAMFNERFAAEVALRIRSGDPLSCIALDVDKFKSINDQYGHPFGDEVLKKIAEALMEICRVEDVACRHGGEEFVILTPRTSADHAALLAERMRFAISQIPFSCKGKSITVTCSFGVAEAVGVYDRLMMERADQALYLSKEQGRNRVSIAPLHLTSQAVAA
jgi:diguanylate cyclase (GGDEF)-like protein